MIAAPIVTAYTLPPELAKKAMELGTFHFYFAIFSLVLQFFLLGLILHFRVSARYRDWAEKFSVRRWIQCFVFTPLFILTFGILGLPADIIENFVERKYGLSVQGWPSWFGDWLTSQALGIALGVVLVAILFWVIRRWPKRWWFQFWLASIPILVGVNFIQPLVVDPLFHKFEPLQSKAPELAARLEELVKKAGQDIPVERMFWMGAGEKTTTLNAYVSGLGASKRIVIWDNTIAKMNTSQIVFVTGHEMGHYVLNHIWKGLFLTSLLFLGLFYLGFRCVERLLSARGERWGIRSVDDWAALPALLLLFLFFGFLSTPAMSAISRAIEHQADQYGLEVTHGLQPDSGQIAAQSFQILGEVDLAEVTPNPIHVWLFFSHPTIGDRVRFALAYDPWSKGAEPEFVQ